MRRALNLQSVAWMFVLITAVTSVARGQDFRIDTDIFVGSDKEPAAEVLTLFRSGNVYDFQLSDTEEITMFEPRRGLLTLINPTKKERTSITTIELLNAAVGLQAAIAEQKNANPIILAAAKPAFDVTSETFEENGSQYTRLNFAGRPIHYTVTAQTARQATAATDYRYFSDWSARLSSLRSAKNLPAGARLEVNDALAKKGLIPIKVERVITEPTIARAGLPKKFEVRSQHLVVWTLSQEDMKRVDRVGDLLADPNVKVVGFEQYCALGAKTAARPAAAPQQQARK